MSIESGNLGKGDNGLPQPTRPGRGSYYELSIHPSAQSIPAETVASFVKINAAIRRNHEQWKNIYAEHINNSKASILHTAERALSRTPHGKRKKALILGAGNCSDIPLPELTDRFDEVTLVEIDNESTERAVKDLSPAQQKKIKIVAADVTGIVGEFAEGINQTLTSPLPDFLVRAAEVIREIDVTEKNPDLEDDYTFVSSHLVMSQLAGLPNNYLRTTIMKRYGIRLSSEPGRDDEQLLNNLNIFNHLLQIEHINLLAKLVSSNGTVHLADTYAKVLPTPDPSQPQILKMILPEIIDPFIVQNFTSSTDEADYWMWDNKPGEYKFFIMSHSLDPKPQTV